MTPDSFASAARRSHDAHEFSHIGFDARLPPPSVPDDNSPGGFMGSESQSASGADAAKSRERRVSEAETALEPDTAIERGIVLSWADRSQARVSIPKPRVLEVIPEHGDVTDEDPGNLLIEGDNRQAMVSLLPQFAGKVDVVLFDVPYNTGKNDFRYNDARFHDPDADTRKGAFVSAEDGGRHAKWLNQMAPTFRITKDLMAPHAVIFVHISDIELPRLMLLMEEVFGEKNKIALITWKTTTDNNQARVSIESEFILVYARSIDSVPTVWRGPAAASKQAMLDEAARLRAEIADPDELAKAWGSYLKANRKELGSYGANYRYIEADGRPFMGDNLRKPGDWGYHDPLLHPITGKPCKEPKPGWLYKKETMDRLVAEGRILFGPDETYLPYYKRYLDDDLTGKLPDILLDFPGRASAADMDRLFPENPNLFKNPKPVALEEYLLSFVAARDALVLDAFAGSGTTGHAVMRLNKRDEGARRFILMEEGNGDDAYAASMTAERLRRARTVEELPGGFTFMRVGPKIDMEAFERLQHKHIVSSILQTDASGRGGGVKLIEGKRYVIGYNGKREAICVFYDPKTHAPVSREVLREMFVEVDELGLARPLRVYGESCEVFGLETFRFFKIPDEILNNLTVSLGNAG